MGEGNPYEMFEFVSRYAENIEKNLYNFHYERPATLSLLPENLSGKVALDVGCGPGAYIAELLKRGAEVDALDSSEAMVNIARLKFPNLKISKMSLDQKLDDLESERYDLVIAPLVFDYICDWEIAFRELHRVMKSGGSLVFSVGHPLSVFKDNAENGEFKFSEKFEINEIWKSYGVVFKSYVRPLDELFNSFLRAGFQLMEVKEPLVSRSIEEQFPEQAIELKQCPKFLCLKIKKIS